MRRVGNLFSALWSFENLFHASRKARRGKRDRADVEEFEFGLESNLVELSRALRTKTYTPEPFRSFMISDPKPRLISAAAYRDRIVHHALCNLLEPIFERSFIHDSYACRKGKGTHAAVRRYQEFAKQAPYVLKCDIRKFFPSIDHQILMGCIRRKIKDPDVLWLVELILSHSNEQEWVSGMFPGDDLLTQLERPRGLPIGNQTSQFFANVFLDSLDHFVRETLRCRYYLRYADDFVILHTDKKHLAEIRAAIEGFLLTRRLWLHPKKRVISRTGDGIRFLGFRVWPEYCWLSSENVLRFRRRLRSMQRAYRQWRLGADEVTRRIQAWVGHASQAKTWNLRQRLLRVKFTRVSPVDVSRCAWRVVQQQQPGEPPIDEPQQQRARES